MEARARALVVSSRAKVERAEVHLKEFDALCEAAYKVDGTGIIIEFQPQPDLRVWDFFLVVPPRISIQMALVVGDVCNNLRSALDQVIFALAVGYEGTWTPSDEWNLQFPIANTLDDWKRVKRYVKSLPEDVIKFVDGKQPYKRGDDYTADPLYLLGYINNRDKHRLIAVNSVVVDMINYTFRSPYVGLLLSDTKAFGAALSRYDPLLTLRFSEPNKTAPDVDIQTGSTICLHNGVEWVFAQTRLKELVEHVSGILDGLVPLFK